jgi:hypothetical protein
MAKQGAGPGPGTTEAAQTVQEEPGKPRNTEMVLFGKQGIMGLPDQIQRLLAPYKTREIAGVSPQWKPDKPGDMIAGVLSRFKQVNTQYGLGSVVSITTKDGPRDVWLGADLKMKIDADSVGRPIVIVYDGEQIVGRGRNSGKAMKAYRVIEVLDVE